MILTASGTTLATLFTNIGSLTTAAIGWMTDWAEAMFANDVIMLFCILIPLVGIGIGLLRRVFRLRA